MATFVALTGHLPRLRRLRAPVAFGAVAVSVGEEAMWRGVVLARLAPAAGLLPAIAVSTAGFAAAHLARQGSRGATLHLGTGAAFGTLFALSGSLTACASAHAAYNVLALAARRRTSAASAAGTGPAAVSLRGVEKRFGSVVALAGVDLEIAEGEIVALLGPNGAGKTTLVSLLLGIRRPDRGTIRVFGRDPREARARTHVGATPQETSLPPTLRVREVAEFVRAHYPRGEPTSALLRRFGLADVASRQTGGLSGGRRRRLAVALAFAGAPRLVVLDEPTTGLDVESRRAVWEEIRASATAGRTVLLTTHDLHEAEALAERIVVVDGGRVVADGTPESLRAGDESSLEEAYLRMIGLPR